MKQFVVLTVVLLVLTASAGAWDCIAGDTTCTVTIPSIPIDPYYDYTESQYCISQTVMAGCFTAETEIISLGWYLCTGPVLAADHDIRVWVELVSGDCPALPRANGTLVYDGPLGTCSSAGCCEVVLDTPFTYLPGNSIVVTVCEEQDGYSAGPDRAWAGNTDPGNGYRLRIDDDPYDCDMTTDTHTVSGAWPTTCFGTSVPDTPTPSPTAAPFCETGTLASHDPDPDTAIPDAGCPTYTSDSITISGVLGYITEVTVRINISHGWDSDLDIYLEHPDGTQVELSTDNGWGEYDYIDTIFDDDATLTITSGSAPFTGRYRPEGNLSDFDLKSPDGEWELLVCDDLAGETGTINYWDLCLETEVSGTPTPVPTSVLYQQDFELACPDDITVIDSSLDGSMDPAGSDGNTWVCGTPGCPGAGTGLMIADYPDTGNGYNFDFAVSPCINYNPSLNSLLLEMDMVTHVSGSHDSFIQIGIATDCAADPADSDTWTWMFDFHGEFHGCDTMQFDLTEILCCIPGAANPSSFRFCVADLSDDSAPDMIDNILVYQELTPCGAPTEGMHCANAIDISSQINGALPVSIPGDTTGAYRYYNLSHCSRSRGAERVYTFTPDTDRALAFDTCQGSPTLTDSVLYVMTGGNCSGEYGVNCDDDGCDIPNTSNATLPCRTYYAGVTYYLFVDGYDEPDYGSYILNITTCSPGIEPECPSEAIYSQRASLVIEDYEAYSSDASAVPAGALFEQIFLTGSACDLTWWGFNFDNTALEACDKTVDFEVTFYTDDGGAPGTVIGTPQTVTPARVNTGILYFVSVPLYEYTATLTPCVDIDNAWISITALEDPAQPDCWFFWCSGDYVDHFALESSGAMFNPIENDLSICVSGTAEPVAIPAASPGFLLVLIITMGGCLAAATRRKR